ncbi:MAG: zinc ribbon domain-containing protein [Desulfomonile tiedjei]|uniref:Zinc ribbon domain-containing protein n=1 Tax=Desulfomonile tiedjei TaxID=2358 RepID=A0A9D6Z4J4_9BACT|nr:zinc ribbon domain-containing protein [Desulfomonile tiedjei]
MALKPCRECGNEVSSDAFSCPKCGAPRPALPTWTGTGYEWKSQRKIFGIPLVHVAFGTNANGRVRIAKGVIAVGQMGIGLITVAQFGIGIIFGLGQFMLGLTVLAQFAGGLLVGIGQLATGVIAVGQFVAGIYGLAQTGWAKYLWSPHRTDMEAVALFYTVYTKLAGLFGF